MNRIAGRVNRWGLALVGLALTLLGGLGLARGLGAFSQNWAAARTPIVDGNVRAFFAGASPWIWWALAVVGVILALIGLRWLFAQGRSEAHGPLRIEDGPAGRTEVSAGSMAHAVAADVESNPAVLRADAGLVEALGRPEVRLRLAADETALMSGLTRHLSTVALPHVRDALDRDHVPAVARVSLEPSPAPHRAVR
ncbi:alkaline shock response membrane anchor protein AmaP [Nonomuraea sp. NPDC002799]